MDHIRKLTLAAEFVNSTIRALADGHAMGSRQVIETAEWARQELDSFIASTRISALSAGPISMVVPVDNKKAA